MKIIEEKPFLKRYKCRECKSTLEADIDDVQVGYFGANYGGDTPDREYYVECPVCGDERILKDSEVTGKVRRVADAKEKR